MMTNIRENYNAFYENIMFQKFIKKEKNNMKKINKKALFGVGAGLITAAIGACCLFKKKDEDEDYVEVEECCDEEDAEVDEPVD